MSNEPQMFRINPENRASEKISEVEFSRLGLQERRDIQEWIAANPGILGEGLLIVSKEFSGFDRINERLDLLAVDQDGKLVVIELKRDDAGTDAHWQAIKYASYLRHATADKIVAMLAKHERVPHDEAMTRLLQHLDADDLNDLNHGQRIILASHRFAPQVTSAVLWLNEKVPDDNLITCVQLIPYHDQQQDALYVQASTIIPLPGADAYTVRIGDSPQDDEQSGDRSYGENLARAFAESQNHETTPFLQRVGSLSIDGLPGEIKPDKNSRWAGNGGSGTRYYHLWYSSPQWANWGMSYRINLYPQGEAGFWRAEVDFRHHRSDVAANLTGVNLHANQTVDDYGITVDLGSDTLNDSFGDRIAETVRNFIQEITPVVNDLENQDDGTD